jgi:hypothetical protein
MGQVRSLHRTRQSSTRCLVLLLLENCPPSASTPHNQPCQMEMVRDTSLCRPYLTNWETLITLPKLLLLEIQLSHSPLRRDPPRDSLLSLAMDHRPNHQMMLFVENCLHLVEGTSTSTPTTIEDHPRMTVLSTQAPATIAAATRRRQAQISQARLLQRWPLTG